MIRVQHWSVTEWLVALATIIPVGVSAVMYVSEYNNRKQATILAAWSVIAQMQGQHASAGRAQALDELKSKNQSLAGIVLDKAILREADLSNTDLSYASLNDLDCTRCRFRGANLFNANLEGGRYKGGCDFSDATLEEARLNNALLADCTFDRASLHRARGDVRTSFNGASMRAIVISNASLPKAIFNNADLSNAQLIDTNVEGAQFQRSVVSGWHWNGVTARYAELYNIHGDRPNSF